MMDGLTLHDEIVQLHACTCASIRFLMSKMMIDVIYTKMLQDYKIVDPPLPISMRTFTFVYTISLPSQCISLTNL